MTKNTRNNTFTINRATKLSAIAAHVRIKNIFLLAAGEGSGKTSFALQIGTRFFDKTIHYHFTNNDKTPSHLCTNLYKALQKQSPDFISKTMEEVAQSGVESLEAGTLISSFLKEYKKNTKSRILIIFDDYQILPSIGVSNLAILSAISSISGNMSFAVCTHINKLFPAGYSKLNKTTFLIDENYLKLTNDEFRELAVTMLEENTVFQSLEKIYELTEGVTTFTAKILDIMSISGSNAQFSLETALAACDDVFCKSVDDLSPTEYNNLLKLSLIPRFTPQLLKHTNQSDNTARLIVKLMDETVLINKNRDEQYRFNHLFHEWLKNEAMTALSETERKDFYSLAAEYEAERHNLSAVAEYLIAAENFDRLEQYLQSNFQDVILNEGKQHLADIFGNIPPDVFRNKAWIPLAFGHTMLFVSPNKTKEIFLHTLDTFTAYGNRVGTIVSACGLLTYYCGTVGDLKEAERYFAGITAMMSETCDELIEPLKMTVCAAYGQGCMNFKDGITATNYLNRSLAIAEKYNAEQFKMHLYALFASSYMTVCERKMSEKYCNMIFQKLGFANQNNFSMLSSLTTMTHHFAMTGQFHAMRLLMNIMRTKYRLHIEHSHRLRSFADICELENAFSTGDMERAKMILNKTSDSSMKNMPEHMASILLSFKAIVLARECDDSAASFAEASLKFRQCEVSGFFNAFTEAAAGAAYTFSANHRKAILHLTKAANQEKQPMNDNAAACAHAYLSYLYSSIGDRMRTREHAIFAVRLMKKIGYTHLSGLLPEVLLNTCIHTVNEPTVSSFALEMAFSRLDTAFDKNMRPIPVMHINTLNSISISVTETTLNCADISAQFRILLAILLSSPGFALDQEMMQVYLWPESTKENARRSLDNLLSRLRKLLSDTFVGIEPKNYISLQNGIVRLHNVSCDAERFNLLIKNAAEAHGKGEYLTTASAVSEAVNIFCGRFYEGVTDVYPVENKRRETDAAFINMLRLMNRLWYFIPNAFDPDSFFERLLGRYMHETELVSMAYGYYAKQEKIQKCKEILKDYTLFLDNEGYSDSEKSELIYFIKTEAVN